MISQLILSQEHCNEMRRHVMELAPLEACGLLAGKNGRVEKVIPVRNQAHSPTRYVMDPYEQLQAFEWIDSQELELIGIFHSHPAGPETVSVTDIEEAAYEVVQVLWYYLGGEWRVRGFWIQDKQVQEVALFIQNQ